MSIVSDKKERKDLQKLLTITSKDKIDAKTPFQHFKVALKNSDEIKSSIEMFNDTEKKRFIDNLATFMWRGKVSKSKKANPRIKYKYKPFSNKDKLMFTKKFNTFKNKNTDSSKRIRRTPFSEIKEDNKQLRQSMESLTSRLDNLENSIIPNIYNKISKAFQVLRRIATKMNWKGLFNNLT